MSSCFLYTSEAVHIHSSIYYLVVPLTIIGWWEACSQSHLTLDDGSTLDRYAI